MASFQLLSKEVPLQYTRAQTEDGHHGETSLLLLIIYHYLLNYFCNKPENKSRLVYWFYIDFSQICSTHKIRSKPKITKMKRCFQFNLFLATQGREPSSLFDRWSREAKALSVCPLWFWIVLRLKHIQPVLCNLPSMLGWRKFEQYFAGSGGHKQIVISWNICSLYQALFQERRVDLYLFYVALLAMLIPSVEKPIPLIRA